MKNTSGGSLARLNIEDSVFRDDRFLDLIVKVGCKFKAKGLLISAWSIAQENWLKYKCVPQKAWPKDLDVLIEVELASRNEDGSVYVKGSKSAFSWINQKSEAGKVGGKSKSENKLKNLKQNKQAENTQKDRNGTETETETESDAPKPLSLSLSLSPSLSLSLSHTHTQAQTLDQDNNTSPSGSVENAVAIPQVSERLISIWNEHCGKLAKVIKSSPQRNRKMKTLWPQIDEAQWIEVVCRLAKSDFCLGKNDRGWKADFDFLLKPDTWSKALEGRYDNRATHQHGMTEDGRYLTPAMKRSHNNQLMIKKYLNNFKEGDSDEQQQEPERDVSLDSVYGRDA